MYILCIWLCILYILYVYAMMPCGPSDGAIRRYAIPGILLRAFHPAEYLRSSAEHDASRHEHFSAEGASLCRGYGRYLVPDNGHHMLHTMIWYDTITYREPRVKVSYHVMLGVMFWASHGAHMVCLSGLQTLTPISREFFRKWAVVRTQMSTPRPPDWPIWPPQPPDLGHFGGS